MSDTFEYNDLESYDLNFRRWYGMNSIEKRKGE